MDSDMISRMEKLLERPLSPAEKERLSRIQNILGVRDNDAIWSIVAAMEYQRAYYEKLPEKIGAASEEILTRISDSADRAVLEAQGRLAESMADHAKNLSLLAHKDKLLLWGTRGVLLLIFYGGLMQWAGFCLGAGKLGPMTDLLRLPIGFVVAALALGFAAAIGWLTARDAAEGGPRWRKRLLVSLTFFVFGAAMLILTVY